MTGVLGSKRDGEAEVRYHKDPHGNVLAMEKNYALLGEYTYDAFGNQLTGAEADTPFRYCGEYFDNESGNIYLRNRYYSTATGRFITEDPIKDGVNWYSYCSNNPVMLIDPLGLKYYDEDDCTEEDIMRGMEEDPIAVIETKDYIEIRAKISFAYYDFDSDDLKILYNVYLSKMGF